MPKSQPAAAVSRQDRRPKPNSKPKKNKAKNKLVVKPTVQVTYEDGDAPSSSRKGKQRATDDDDVEELSEGDEEEEDVKPMIEETAAPPLPAGTFISHIQQSFVIIAGSYEKNLYGIQANFSDDSNIPTLEPIFIFPAHLSCIKAVASAPVGGRWLATGSDDEIVKVWDLRKRKEVGGLSQHVGSITALTFPTKAHLLSASEDSTISLFRTKDWALLRSLKGHSGRVNSIDVHPSGKVALSVGKDKTLKMWDLMRGRGAASLPLGVEAEVVRWAKSGRYFGVLSPKGIDIYSTKMKLLSSVKHPKRLHDIVFCQVDDEDVMLTGTEDGKLLVYDVDADKGQCELKGSFGGHSNRIKSLSHVSVSRPSQTLEIVCTVSSDGRINVYDLGQLPPAAGEEGQPIACYDTKGSRLVCCSISQPDAPRATTITSKEDKGANGAGDDDEDMYGDEPAAGEDDEEEEEEEEEHEVEEE